MKKNRKQERTINEDSFFATKESVGCHWQAVRKAIARYKSVKGTGAVQRSKTPHGVVVVNPTASTQ